jgi:hypothetical protein
VPARVARRVPVVAAAPTVNPLMSSVIVGSLAVTACSTNPAGPDPESVTDIVICTGTSLPFGGQMTDRVARHVTVGGVTSISVAGANGLKVAEVAQTT